MKKAWIGYISLFHIGFYFVILFNLFMNEQKDLLMSSRTTRVFLNVANWPSIAFEISPLTQSMGDAKQYIDMSLGNPFVFLINVIGWGILGLITGIAIYSFRRKK